MTDPIQMEFADAIIERAQRDYRTAPHGQKTAKLKKLRKTLRAMLELETALSSHKATRRAA